MNKNKILAKLFSICLAVMMMLSLGITANAATTAPTGSVTVKGLKTDGTATVKLYQVINVSWDESAGQPKEPVYNWVTEFAAGLQEKGTYAQYVNTNNSVNDTYFNLTAADLRNITAELKTIAIEEPITATVTETLNANTHSVTFNNLAMGQYIVVVDGANYSVGVANLKPVYENGQWTTKDVTVSLKGSDITITKSADDEDVQIGDTITYTVETLLPVYPADATNKKFIITDTLGAGLTYKNIESIYLGNEKDDSSKIDLTKDIHYTLNDPITNTIVINFKYDNMSAANNTASKEYVYVTYKAEVNKNALNENALKNTVKVNYASDPYDDNDNDEKETNETVYTYALDVTKVDATDHGALLGAEFKLYTDSTCQKEVKFVLENGVYRVAASDETNYASSLATDGQGKLYLKGLDNITYYLKETKAPNGYVLPSNPVTTVDLSSGTEGKFGTLTAHGLTVENKKSGDFTLPITGGTGTLMFTVAGIALVAGGLFLVVASRKKVD